MKKSKIRLRELLVIESPSLNEQEEIWSYINDIWNKKFWGLSVDESISSVASDIHRDMKRKCEEFCNLNF